MQTFYVAIGIYLLQIFMLQHYINVSLTLMLLVANLADTTWDKKPEK